MEKSLLMAAMVVGCGSVAGMSLAGNVEDIFHQPKITISVGDGVVVHGLRGECGELPPDSARVPFTTKLGHITYGKEGYRWSKLCGLTPAIQVIYFGERKGTENIELYGDPTQITVE